jgi:hypothetical protein
MNNDDIIENTLRVALTFVAACLVCVLSAGILIIVGVL